MQELHFLVGQQKIAVKASEVFTVLEMCHWVDKRPPVTPRCCDCESLRHARSVRTSEFHGIVLPLQMLFLGCPSPKPVGAAWPRVVFPL